MTGKKEPPPSKGRRGFAFVPLSRARLFSPQGFVKLGKVQDGHGAQGCGFAARVHLSHFPDQPLLFAVSGAARCCPGARLGPGRPVNKCACHVAVLSLVVVTQWRVGMAGAPSPAILSGPLR